MTTEPPTEQLGMEGEACAQCGAELATDQRYCLNCGAARTGPRLDFSQHLNPAMGGAPAAAAVPAMAGVPAAAGTGTAAGSGMQQINPITAIFAIALLGVMLLLGVLIGKDDEATTVAAAPATTTTAAATAPIDTAAAAGAAKDKGKGADAAAAPGEGNVISGGSGDTSGVAAANTGASPEEALKGPDVVATQGEPEKLDPGGPVGGGSDAVCIGC